MKRFFYLISAILFICSCGKRAEIEVVEEIVEPEGLGPGSSLFVFESDSVGYAATTHYSEWNGIRYGDSFIVSKTTDRGKTWETFGSGGGEVVCIKQTENYLFYVTRKLLKEHSYKYEIRKTEKSQFRPRRIARKSIEYGRGIYGFHAFNDSTLCFFSGHSDLIKVSYNGGRKWERIAMQQDPGHENSGVLYENGIDFDVNKIYVKLDRNGKKGDFTAVKIGVIDVYSKEQKYFPGNSYGYELKASGDLLAMGRVKLYSIKGNSLVKEPGIPVQHLGGLMAYDLLECHNDIMICCASNYRDGSVGSFSAGAGYKSHFGWIWQRLEVKYNADPGRMTIIPDSRGVSILYPFYNESDSKLELHILKFTKK